MDYSVVCNTVSFLGLVRISAVRGEMEKDIRIVLNISCLLDSFSLVAELIRPDLICEIFLFPWLSVLAGGPVVEYRVNNPTICHLLGSLKFDIWRKREA